MSYTKGREGGLRTHMAIRKKLAWTAALLIAFSLVTQTACGQAAQDMAGVQAESGGWKLEFTDVFDMHSNEMRTFVRQSIALQIG
ncbi:MAG: hypothetical protein QF541_10955, partial [Lentisphaeria bacterium]|nr:hypothetical protein [Lentisphaeria bacterium]